jgi:hypothetical protein
MTKKYKVYVFDEDENEWVLIKGYSSLKKARKMVDAGLRMDEIVVLGHGDCTPFLHSAHSTDVQLFPQ